MVNIQFHNRTVGEIIEIQCAWDSVAFIIEWYRSHYSADDWIWIAQGK